MANGTQSREARKNPALAAVISAIFPGTGLFYVGNYVKGIAYIVVFAVLVALEVHASEYGTRVVEIVVFGLLIAGFYIFQIVDSFNEARMTVVRTSEGREPGSGEELSLFGAILILVLGVVFQLANLDVLTYGQIIKLWPLFLIGLGVKFIVDFYSKKEGSNG